MLKVKSQWPSHIGDAVIILNTEYDMMVVSDLVGSSFVLSQCCNNLFLYFSDCLNFAKK